MVAEGKKGNGSAASSADGVVYRDLESDSDLDLCVALQQEIWGSDFQDLVAPAILKISQKVGGLVIGAFRDDGSGGEEMLGFVFGLSGLEPRDGGGSSRKVHWSHMLGVTRNARGLGLGRKLKLIQRERAIELDVEAMYWTYDPLIARNARLNLERLGALPKRYVRDMYGEDTGSVEHLLGTDRLIVEWQLAEPAVDLAIATGNRPPGPAQEACGVVPLEGTPDATDRVVYIECPADIRAIVRQDPDAAVRLRKSGRRAWEHYLGRGYRCTGFAFPEGASYRDEEVHCYYRLEGAERDHGESP